MLITYLKLEQYKRFPLSSVEIFEKEFTHKLTVILGPNGSGKSSLVSELTPLPTSKDYFNPGGYKEIHITHDGQNYRLICDFKNGAKYSFFWNDEDLNTSKNVTMQKELVYQHFGITEIIHKLLTGEESFTEMGIPARKKLIHAITHLNIDTILANYEKLKEDLRNQEFLLKTLTNQCVQEQDKLSDPELGNRLKERSVNYQDYIERLLNIRQEIYRYAHADSVETSSLALSRLEEDRKSIWKKHQLALSAYSVKDIPLKKNLYETVLKDCDKLLQACYQKLESLQREAKTLNSTNHRNVEQLKSEYEVISSQKDRLLASVVILADHDDIPQATATLQILENSLPEILETLPPNEDGMYSKQKYSELLEQENKLLTKQNESVREHSRISAELKEAKAHKDLTCPNCNHTWLPEDIDSTIKRLTSELKALDLSQYEVVEKLKEIRKESDCQQAYLIQLSLLMNLYTSTKTKLFSFWKMVSDLNLVKTDPSQILILVRTALRECQTLSLAKELSVKLKDTEDLINRVQLLSHDSQATIDKESSSIEEEILQLQDDREEVLEDLESVLHTEKVYTALRTIEAACNLAKSDLQESNLQHIASQIIKTLDSELSIAKVTLLETEKEISKLHQAESSLKKLEAQREQVAEHIKVLTIITDELSPKNGYIAKTISHSLNVIINSINAVINSVWDYKMTLKPLNIEEDALNYKFKVEVEDRLTIDDISKISSGMKEITNLGMKVTLYKLLRLENYPVYLDEYGVKLDETHRSKITDIIFKMIGSSTYSQIFLITHLDMSYHYSKDTDILEM